MCGATSQMSKPIVEELEKRGYEVDLLSNSDLSTPAPLLAYRFDGAFAVLNIIGTPYFAKWSDRYVHDIYCSRMLAIRAILETIKHCEKEPKTFLHVTNAMVYDQYEVHDDYSMSYSDSFIAEVGRMETIEVLKAQKKVPNLRLIIARTGYIMSRNGGLFPILEKVCRNHIGAKIGDGYQCLPIIHISDAINAMITLIENRLCQGVYNLTIPRMASLRELSTAFEKYGKIQRIKLPDFIVRLIVGRSIVLLEQNCKVIPTRLEQLQYEFQYPSVDKIVGNLY